MIENKSTILFQGDSITDSGRRRSDFGSLGEGYPTYVASLLAVLKPELELTFINRGVSGDRVCDMQARWQSECIDLKPDIISILIGVNDTLRNFDSAKYNPPEEFEAQYRSVIESALKNTKAKLMIIEPFLVPVSPAVEKMRVDLDPKIHVVRKLVSEYKIPFIPMDGIFASYSAHKEPKFWAEDGIHPTRNGHLLIAENWINTIA